MKDWEISVIIFGGGTVLGMGLCIMYVRDKQKQKNEKSKNTVFESQLNTFNTSESNQLNSIKLSEKQQFNLEGKWRKGRSIETSVIITGFQDNNEIIDQNTQSDILEENTKFTKNVYCDYDDKHIKIVQTSKNNQIPDDYYKFEKSKQNNKEFDLLKKRLEERKIKKCHINFENMTFSPPSGGSRRRKRKYLKTFLVMSIFPSKKLQKFVWNI